MNKDTLKRFNERIRELNSNKSIGIGIKEVIEENRIVASGKKQNIIEVRY